MEKSNKTVFQFNWVSVLIIFGLLAGCIFFALKTNTSTKRADKFFFENGVLTEQLNQSEAKRMAVEDTVKILKEKIRKSDVFVAEQKQTITSLKRKYADSKPSPCDTVEKLINCDNLVRNYEGYTEMLNYNIRIRQNLIDTLQLENKLLEEEQAKCLQITTKYGKELTATKKGLRATKIWAWTATGGAVVLGIIVLL